MELGRSPDWMSASFVAGNGGEENEDNQPPPRRPPRDAENDDESNGSDDTEEDSEEELLFVPQQQGNIPTVQGIPVDFLMDPNQTRIVKVLMKCLREGKNVLIEHPIDPDRRDAVLSTSLSFLKWLMDAHDRSLSGPSSSTANVLRKICVGTKSVAELKQVRSRLLEMPGAHLLDAFTLRVLGSQDFEDLNEVPENGPLELLICPHEYILSAVHRQDHKIDPKDAILIFDDGYQIEKNSCDQGSIIITAIELRRITRCLDTIAVNLSRAAGVIPDVEQKRSSLAELCQGLRELAQWLRENADVFPSKQEIWEVLTDQFNASNFPNWQTNLFDILQLGEDETIVIPDPDLVNTLRQFITVLNYMMDPDTHDEDYRATVRVTEPPPEYKNRPSSAALQLICANAAVVFKRIGVEAHSVVVSSSCLAPIPPIRDGLGVEFEHIVEIDGDGVYNNRFLSLYCSAGPSDIDYLLTFGERGDPMVQKEMGEGILKICEAVPGRIMVAFHSCSKQYLRRMIQQWEVPPEANTPSIMSRIRELKHVVSELDMVNAETREQLLEEYKTECGDDKGALLLCMHRGDIYNQVPFPKLRAVVHASVPYAPWFELDNHVLARRDYFDMLYGPKSAENLEWYTREAYRKLNESFGMTSTFQGEDEWGIVLVLDNRMYAKRFEFKTLLPAWVRDGTKHREFNIMIQDLEEFVAQVNVGENE